MSLYVHLFVSTRMPAKQPGVYETQYSVMKSDVGSGTIYAAGSSVVKMKPG